MEVLSKTISAALASAEVEQGNLRTEVDQLGAARWWAEHMPGEPEPATLTAEGILAESAGYWAWAAERVEQCRRCPAEGGACAGPENVMHGKLPIWLDATGTPSLQRCDRWPEFLVRQALVQAGVDPRSLGYRLATFDLQPENLPAVQAFVDAVLVNQDSWLIVSGPRESGKTHLTVGVLREVKTCSRFRAWVVYVNVFRFARTLKSYYAKEIADDPLYRIKEAPILFLDNLDLSTTQPWLRTALQDVIAFRWSMQRPTFITTHDRARDLVRHLTEVTGFSQVPEIVLEPG